MRWQQRIRRGNYYRFWTEPRIPQDQATVARRLGRLEATRTPCSCWMCGNPRRLWNALPRQEIVARRALEDEEDEQVA
jgi:hypothetical protein